MAWASITDLETHLGFQSDARMADALNTSLAWCNRQRPDLPAAGPVGADVTTAVLIYAGLLYRSRSSPQGFDGYSELGDYDTADAMSNVYRLLGHRKPRVG
jgi:hypothetical protein